ncbi:LOW QUALITY PROTEIN: calcitonin receptor-like protein 1 [Hyalella azteca]|uniref:LOW QUALITY PROTEIN: calcitonin receptor-like protein 1 n=1 Tax=Hyalella azteca TaxID=294128 RepID=A0A8B7PLM6_HYAAZ|nr:LOW QUALITY PROTEIN: calcitonin receptor-like protein 1 [Hyalella azteca]
MGSDRRSAVTSSKGRLFYGRQYTTRRAFKIHASHDLKYSFSRNQNKYSYGSIPSSRNRGHRNIRITSDDNQLFLVSNATDSNVTVTNISDSNVSDSNTSDSNTSQSNTSDSNISDNNSSDSNASYSNVSESNSTDSNASDSIVSESNSTDSNASDSIVSESNSTDNHASDSHVSYSKNLTLEAYGPAIVSWYPAYINDEYTREPPSEHLLLAWQFTSQEDCSAFHFDSTQAVLHHAGARCEATWDNILCWPPAPLGAQVFLPCPPFEGVDPTKLASRRCGLNGTWLGRNGGSNQDVGWSNYTDCFTPDVRHLLNQLYSGSREDAQLKVSVARSCRAVEVAGLALSLVSLLLSLCVFNFVKFVDFRGPSALPYFRKSRNNRSRIHKNLFVAMLLQAAVRMVLYADQAALRGDSVGVSASVAPHRRRGIDATPILCETFHVMLEYGRSAMFMWMFIEGMYLNNLISVAFFQGPPNYCAYYCIGWGVPAVVTTVWAAVMAVGGQTGCWVGYSSTASYWILEGPRLTIIAANLLFLLNIMRTLLSKLREANTCEAQQIRPLRRSVRNALCLLPLLGITNAITMIPKPLERSAFEFGVWSYSTNILTSFQGFVVSCIYCFFNADVQRTLCYLWRVKITLRPRARRTTTLTVATLQPREMYGITLRPSTTHYKSRRQSSLGQHQEACAWEHPPQTANVS